MAITKGAKKAIRQSKRKNAMNEARRRTLRDALKGTRLAQRGDTEAISAAYQAIDKALKRGLIKKNTAARRKAKVARLLSTK
jgi:small subunit ribosomal protein S20